MYYITYYEAFPIYEHAEGGYYYEGREALEWAYDEDWNEIYNFISEYAERLGFKNLLPYGNSEELLRTINNMGSQMVACEHAKYIGDDRYLVVENEKEFKKFSKYKQPYC